LKFIRCRFVTNSRLINRDFQADLLPFVLHGAFTVALPWRGEGRQVTSLVAKLSIKHGGYVGSIQLRMHFVQLEISNQA
jgi:hypothetical protein